MKLLMTKMRRQKMRVLMVTVNMTCQRMTRLRQMAKLLMRRTQMMLAMAEYLNDFLELLKMMTCLSIDDGGGDEELEEQDGEA